MTEHVRRASHRAARCLVAALLLVGLTEAVRGQPAEMLEPNLTVAPFVSGLTVPTTMAFIDDDELLVLEKNTGHVKHVIDGVVQGVVLDLAVNFGSERGLLGIALHPDFPDDPGVYLFWTESTTGEDTNDLSNTSLLGNRVDRYAWDGASLTHDHNLLRIRAIQEDENQPPRGNHDGGVMTFGHDGKLYVFIGDLGRRGQLQNLPCGPTPECPGAIVPDDQFGGPEPDDAHLSGVVLRLNDDGSAPADNPFYDVGAAMGGEVGENLQRLFTYGHRNSFGIAVDPKSGNVWLQENGDDSFSELNRLEPGMNGGWVQIAGPVERIHQFKEIETTFGNQQMQQVRWPPTNIADSPEEALASLFTLPGSVYRDPAFSWKWEVAPGGIGFVDGRGLGRQFDGDLLMGAATPVLEDGYLFRFNLTGNRLKVGVDDPRLADRVADNLAKHEITESESLLIGRNFGVVTDIETGPDGNVYAVSLSHGTIYKIEAVARGKGQAIGPAETGSGHVALHPNYPDPFNPVTSIRFSLPEDMHVRLAVYDVMGRRVALLVDGVQTAGEHELSFDASHLPSGVYLYRIETDSFAATRRMHVLK